MGHRPWLQGGAARTALLAIGLAVGLLATTHPATAADDDWVIQRFDSRISIRADASIDVVETIAADFGRNDKHGIYRSIPIVYSYPSVPGYERVYRLSVDGITNGAGRSWPYQTSEDGADLVMKIGDPGRTVSGRQTYRISYHVEGALNAFDDHDELYWNANGGGWPVTARAVTATVILPAPGLQRAAAYQGARGSKEAATSTAGTDQVTFSATRALRAGEQLTVVAALPKGMVAEPSPILRKVMGIGDMFTITPGTILGALIVLLAGLLYVGGFLWFHGRDREYRTVPELTGSRAERIAPVFRRSAVVAEYEPPYQMRPAELSLLLNERVDGRDVTATIIDLAVRGHLTIAEGPDPSDWTLTRADRSAEGIREYERALLDSIFRDSPQIAVSALRPRLVIIRRAMRQSLDREAIQLGWFTGDPDRVRRAWSVAGACVIALGLLLEPLLAPQSVGLIGLAIVADGALLLLAARAMPRRSAWGRELRRRVLGFRLYLLTAERERQRFAERAGMFTTYLPYAIAFGCTLVWARAFTPAGVAAATTGWYAGTGTFDGDVFSTAMWSGATSSWLGSSVRSIEFGGGGSGSSGFDFGSAGDGGGGGGGGSW